MLRTYTKFASSVEIALLDELLGAKVSYRRYQEITRVLGDCLGMVLENCLYGTDSCYLATSLEDADNLALRVINKISDLGILKGLSCFSKKAEIRPPSESVGLMVQDYSEPVPYGGVDTLVFVKSIVSDISIVKSNISELIKNNTPQRIVVASLIMDEMVPYKLSCVFDEIAIRFEFFNFVSHSNKETSEANLVEIDDDPLELFEIRDPRSIHRFTPMIVQLRRALLNGIN